MRERRPIGQAIDTISAWLGLGHWPLIWAREQMILDVHVAHCGGASVLLMPVEDRFLATYVYEARQRQVFE